MLTADPDREQQKLLPSEKCDLMAAMEASHRRFYRLFDTAPVGYLVIDSDAVVQEANLAAAGLLGIERRRLVRRPFEEFLSNESRQMFLRHHQAAFDRTEKSVCELMLVHECSRISVRMESVLLHDPTGQHARMLSALVDVSELVDANRQLSLQMEQLRRVERALRRSEEEFRAIFENASDGIFIHDMSGRVLKTNDIACSRLLYEPGALVGWSISDLEPCEFGQTMSALSELRTSDHVVFETAILRRDGVALPVEINSRLTEICGEKVVLSIARDIAERRRAAEKLRQVEEQLIQAQKMEAIGRLAGGIAHDFNNMLTTIIGRCDRIMKTPDDAHSVLSEGEEIRRAAEMAAGLTRQLLAFGRKQIMSPRVVELRNIILNLQKMLERLLGEDITLVTLFAAECDRVYVDPLQLEQVILNLAVNARDSMPHGGRLTLVTANVDLSEEDVCGHVDASTGPHVCLAVSDSGCGMPQEVLDRIFEPFYTTKPLGQGTGLGLSTVHGIVIQSGGHVTVESNPGRGSTFRIYLPLSALPYRAEASRTFARYGEVSGGSEVVIVVEDEEVVRKLTALELKERGYRVIDARDGEEALQKAKAFEGKIDLLVSDVILPGMNGRELYERLSALRPGLQVLYVSGHTEAHIVNKGALIPGTAFVQKPFSADKLAAKMRDVLDTVAGEV